MDYIEEVVHGNIEKDYEQFLKTEDDLSMVDEEMMKAWHLRSHFWQMIDVWSEVDQAKWLWKKWCKTKKHEDYIIFLAKMREVNNLCCIVRADPMNSRGLKWELKASEWELYDFFFWGNQSNNTIDSVSSWFDERRYKINYDLLKEKKKNCNIF